MSEVLVKREEDNEYINCISLEITWNTVYQRYNLMFLCNPLVGGDYKQRVFAEPFFLLTKFLLCGTHLVELELYSGRHK